MPAETLFLLLAVFPLFWCAIILIISWTGGWWALSKKYAADAEPLGK